MRSKLGGGEANAIPYIVQMFSCGQNNHVKKKTLLSYSHADLLNREGVKKILEAFRLLQATSYLRFSQLNNSRLET